MSENHLLGADQLVKHLNDLGGKLGVKVMRAAARKALRPTVRIMQSRAPVGRVAHRTYKGRLVTPGFLKRNIRLIVQLKKNEGKIVAVIGTRKEAYYGVQFYDQGPKNIRRKGKGIRSGRIASYTLKKIPFFQSVFFIDRSNIERRFAEELAAGIKKYG